MTDGPLAFALEVVGGPDHGARLDVDGSVRTIGRARDADLALNDPAVSRRHVQVTATEAGVQIAVCGNASSFVMDGEPRRTLQARRGDRIVVGNTQLVVVERGERTAAALAEGGSQTDVGTLLTGAAADVRAMAAVHTLVEALDTAGDRAALERELRTWAARFAMADRVDVPGSDRSSGAALSTLVEAPGEPGITCVTVPARAEEPIRLTFHCARGALGESFRRMLIVAGRVFGSALTRAAQQQVAREDAVAMRALSFGSARAFLGTSPQAQQVAAMIGRLAASDVPVLLEGETGVGKTFVARLLHESGGRAPLPMRVLNCAAIPEALVESELFGHERGAFTGAVAGRVGALESAGRGTLFLDEIGELSLANQAKLLRAVEERRFERVGSNQPIELRARVLYATNRDLEAMVAEKLFRSDLFFRVTVVRLTVPPLRERGDDLRLLSQQILSDVAQSAGRRVTGFTPEALAAIGRYSWPGNVRELRNAIERAVALGDGALIDAADLPSTLARPEPQPSNPDLVRLPLDLATLERRGIEAALRETRGNRARAAVLLGINRTTLYAKLKEFGEG